LKKIRRKEGGEEMESAKRKSWIQLKRRERNDRVYED
jgi:hypothetical protein